MAKAKTGEKPGSAGRVRDLHAIKVRVPEDVRSWLIAASGVLNKPQWQVIVDALLAYVGEREALSAEKVKAIRTVRRTQQANGKR